MRSIGLLLVFAGCHQASLDAIDAPVVDTPDAPANALGVIVPWSARPSLPGVLNDRITVSEATFHISHLQIVGDAGPGDERTTRSRYSLSWNSLGPPAPENFPNAPIGVYSKITIEMAPYAFGQSAYTIEGTWLELDDDRDFAASPRKEALKPFRITDFAPLEATMDCDDTLPAGGAAMVPVRLQLLDIIAAIDFERLREDNGTLVLGAGDPQLQAFRAGLARAFVNDQGPPSH